MNINESKGTPSIIRGLINKNIKTIDNILKNCKNNVLNLVIDESTTVHTLNKKDKVVYLKCNLNIFFNFENVSNYKGSINFKDCIKSDFKNCKISLYIPESSIDRLSVLKSLSHELTHLYELYQIKDIYDSTKWNRSEGLVDFDKSTMSKPGLIRYFRDLFYNALPHEIRSKSSSMEIYLYGLKDNNQITLVSELEKTNEWKSYNKLVEFDTDLYLKDLTSRFDISFLLGAFNLFNKIMDIDITIKDKNDLLKYFNRSKKYFKRSADNFITKVNRIIKDITEGSTSDYIMETVNILSYSEYFNDKSYLREMNLENLLEVDYKKILEYKSYNLSVMW